MLNGLLASTDFHEGSNPQLPLNYSWLPTRFKRRVQLTSATDHPWHSLMALEGAAYHKRSNIKYPLLICYIAIEHHHRNSGFTHETWWFSNSYVSLPEGIPHFLPNFPRPLDHLGSGSYSSATSPWMDLRPCSHRRRGRVRIRNRDRDLGSQLEKSPTNG